MGTRIRDKASNTDSSIILDSGTSYVKRDDQTTPVYRGVTSTNLIGGLGGGLVATHTIALDGSNGTLPALDGWRPGYKVLITGMVDNAASDTNSYSITNQSRILTEVQGIDWNYTWGGFSRWGGISINESTGEITHQGFQGVTLFVSVYTSIGSASTAATQVNLDAALARITQLENNAGGLIDVTSYTISSSPHNLGTFPNFDPSQRVYWTWLWVRVPTNGTRTYQNAQQTGPSISVSSTGQITGWSSGTTGESLVTLARFGAA